MDYICKYCEYKGPREDFEGDHEPPNARLQTVLDLLSQKVQLICSGCNRQKGEKTDLEYRRWRFFNPTMANYGPIRL